MLRSIKLYGHLREVTGLSEFKAHAKTVRDAVSALVCNWPKLEGQIAQNSYHVLIGNDDVGTEEIDYPAGTEAISLIPVIEGAGNRGRIIMGIALIGLAISTGGFSLAAAGGGFVPAANVATWAAKGAGWALLGKVGIYLTLSGVAGMLSDTPDVPSSDQEQKSFAFQSPLNVSFAGIPIPIIYGTAIVGSVVVNAGQEIGDVS